MEDRKYCVYMLTSPSGKSYVGLTGDIKDRFKRHQKETSACLAIKSAIQKHGWDKFKKFILHDNLTLDEANRLEHFEVKCRNTIFPNGYNLKDGGNSGGSLSDEVKRKIGDANRGKKHTPEQVEAQRARCLGTIISDETKMKMSIAQKGKPKSPEHIEKVRQKSIGRIATEETKLKLSQSHLGFKPTDITKIKLKENQQRLRIEKELPFYKVNLAHIKEGTFDTGFISEMLGTQRCTIGKRIRDGLFPNAFHTQEQKGGKKYFIPIQDIHDFYR